MRFLEEYLRLDRLDRLSYQDTAVHRLDPRAKVIATLLFVTTVVSFPKYDILSLLPLFLFPVLFAVLGDIPGGLIARKVAAVSPFALFVGIFNPLLDRGTVAIAPGIAVAAGWLSFASILVKFSLSISAALLLIATTSFPGICHALNRLGFPDLFVTQLLFLYRYLFVLLDEASRMVRARESRSFGGGRIPLRLFARLAGELLVRTVERAERIHGAMLARGFRGEMPARRPLSMRKADAAFLAATVALLLVVRFLPVPETVGRFARSLFA